MERIVIAIDNSYMANQLGLNDYDFIVESRTGEKVKCFLHRNPLIKSVGYSDLQANFDILIGCVTDEESVPLHALLPEHQRVNLVREAKSVTRFKINRACAGIPGFKPMKAHWTNDTLLKGNSGQFGNAFSGGVVLKVEYGARGAGQALFNTFDISPSAVVKGISGVYEKFRERALEEDLDNKILSELKSVLPDVAVGYDKSRGPLESIRELATSKLYLEGYVAGVTNEYRILFAGEDRFIFEREIEDVGGFKQAVGSNGGMKEPILESEIAIPAGTISSILKALNAEGITYGSVDLFVAGNIWGLFEYSTQFATNGVAPRFSAVIQEKYMVSVVDHFLIGRASIEGS